MEFESANDQCSVPFPHLHRLFPRGGQTDTLEPDYMLVSELGERLEQCRMDEGIVVLLGVTVRQKLSDGMSRDLAWMLWDSFLRGQTDGPFGDQFQFDGVQLTVDEASVSVAQIVFEELAQLQHEARRTPCLTSLLPSEHSASQCLNVSVNFVVLTAEMAKLWLEASHQAEHVGIFVIAGDVNVQEGLDASSRIPRSIGVHFQNLPLSAGRAMLARMAEAVAPSAVLVASAQSGMGLQPAGALSPVSLLARAMILVVSCLVGVAWLAHRSRQRQVRDAQIN